MGEIMDGDFLLGLDVLDLCDFSVVEEGVAGADLGEEDGRGGGGGGGGGGQLEQGETAWTRSCRCGAASGFRIAERQLESAERRGETEVLVGCEGCSLWVRVGFAVEHG